MSDPYTFAEKKYNLTGKALAVIADYGFSVNMITKSNMILKDMAVLKRINRNYACICFTVTTTDESLAKSLEPGAPGPADRFEAMRALAGEGILTGVTMMPILPFIEDNEQNIAEIVKETAKAGGRFIIPWFGMSLRDRQRLYYYEKLDQLFPGLREKYEKGFGDEYNCMANQHKRLNEFFQKECKKYGIMTSMKELVPKREYEQLRLI
jgi:DNA repair photolyase